MQREDAAILVAMEVPKNCRLREKKCRAGKTAANTTIKWKVGNPAFSVTFCCFADMICASFRGSRGSRLDLEMAEEWGKIRLVLDL